MQNIVLTGATSMIGIAIIKEALISGKNVAAIVRKGSSRLCYLDALGSNKNLSIIECDIDNYNSLKLDTSYDTFFHLAWKNTDSESRDDVYAHASNIMYTIDAVEAARNAGCSVFVFAGSQAEYGRVNEKLSGETICNPESGYGVAKYAAGKMARLLSAKYNLRYCHARILSTYGEGMGDGALIMYLINTMLSGNKPSLTKCEQLWDFQYVEDTAKAMLSVAENGHDGKIYPIGNGIARPLCDYIEITRDIIDPSLHLDFGEKDYYPHQAMYLCADINELQADTGFEPCVSFEDGIRKMIDWVIHTRE